MSGLSERTIVRCEECGQRPAIKTDGQGREVCRHCAAGLPDPFKRMGVTLGRNDNCTCGSGKKFKRCCLPKLK